ncbi:Hypothetical protein YtvA [Bacillus subtilis subsp. subtilis str. BSP1]|nr:Hypothetical protein YtvA [Bacillus subtilis subsp. subtilis str. BSP1]
MHYSPSPSLFIVSSKALRASFSSAPEAEIVISAPLAIPKDITPIIDLRLTVLPLYSKLTSASYLLAVCTRTVAGRAWIPESAVTFKCFFVPFFIILLLT